MIKYAVKKCDSFGFAPNIEKAKDLFSDDLDWCNKMSNELGLDAINHKLIIVNGNNGENAYRDMQLMTMCHHRISDHSSFSLMAAVLCQYPNKEEFFNWKTQV